MNRKIIKNAAKCLLCGDIIESKNVHDFKMCSCENIFVDGGHEYIRRGFREGPDTYEDLNEYKETED